MQGVNSASVDFHSNFPKSEMCNAFYHALCKESAVYPWIFTLSSPSMCKRDLCSSTDLEGQQRYFSHRAMLVAIVLQNSVVLVFMGSRTIIPRYVAKRGIAQMCLCETQCQEGVLHHFGGVLTSLNKYRAIWGIAAIVSQYRAIWGH